MSPDTLPELARKERYAQIGPVMDIASSSNWADQWSRCSSLTRSYDIVVYIFTYISTLLVWSCLLTDITLVFFVFTVLSYTQWTTKSWTLFKSLFSWYRCPTSRSDWWTTCKIMQDLNDDIADINEADSRTTVTPMDNCSIQFSRQRQVHGCSW